MSRHVHAEIEYILENEEHEAHSVHSDICPPGCEMSNSSDEEYRKLLHDCLDEWLEKSRGTGIFYITGEREKYLKHICE